MALLLLSGAIAAGKSSVADRLVADRDFVRIRSSGYLRDVAAVRELPTDRTALQELGDALDRETDFRWVVDAVAIPQMERSPEARFVFDSVRKPRQVAHFRNAVSTAVFHVFLSASEEVLRERYQQRQRDLGTEGPTYEDAARHPNEVAARSLVSIADEVIDITSKTPEQICEEVFNGFTHERSD
jgi:adenylosuccinate synthase